MELSIKFQVAGVKKPLLAVRRITEKGNQVVFGPRENYILNVETGTKLPIRPNGRGSYLLDVELGGAWTTITLDSGAEESVCPMDWGKEFGLHPSKKIQFSGANGSAIEHYGMREVTVKSPF